MSVDKKMAPSEFAHKHKKCDWKYWKMEKNVENSQTTAMLEYATIMRIQKQEIISLMQLPRNWKKYIIRSKERLIAAANSSIINWNNLTTNRKTTMNHHHHHHHHPYHHIILLAWISLTLSHSSSLSSIAPSRSSRVHPVSVQSCCR